MPNSDTSRNMRTPRSAPLTNKACQAKANGKLQKLSDANGLQLWVQPNGSRLWRLAYRFQGKQKLLALGTYPETSLQAARELRDEARKLLRAGTDPSVARKEAKAATAVGDTFKAVAEEYIAKKRREGRANSTISKLSWLLSFAYQTLGGTSDNPDPGGRCATRVA